MLWCGGQSNTAGGLLHDCTVEELEFAAGGGGNAVAGDDDADKVGGVGGGELDELRRGGPWGLCAKGVGGLGEGELLSGDAGDEATTTDLAAGFEAAEDGSEVAPLGGIGLAGEEVAEEDAVAGKEHARGGLHGGVVEVGALDAGFGGVGGGIFGVRGYGSIGAEEGPATSGGSGGGAASGGGGGWFDGGGLAFGIHESAELVEAIGGGEAGGGELPERVLGLLFGEGEVALEVGGEAGTAAVELGADLEGFGAEGLGEVLLVDAGVGEGPGEPIGGVAEVESDRRGVSGDDAAGCGAGAGRPGGVGGDAAPADRAREAEVVEPGGGVDGDACGEQGALPLDGGGFETFELREGVEEPVFAGELGVGREVLPAEEPAHVGGGGDGLDAFAEGGEGEAVDALEESAVAPLDVVIGGDGGGFEVASHNEALHLGGQEGGAEGGGV